MKPDFPVFWGNMKYAEEPTVFCLLILTFFEGSEKVTILYKFLAGVLQIISFFLQLFNSNLHFESFLSARP